MLVLNRKVEDVVRISFGANSIEIKVLSISRNHVRLGFNGPREIQVDRGELQEAPADMLAEDE